MTPKLKPCREVNQAIKDLNKVGKILDKCQELTEADIRYLIRRLESWVEPVKP